MLSWLFMSSLLEACFIICSVPLFVLKQCEISSMPVQNGYPLLLSLRTRLELVLQIQSQIMFQGSVHQRKVTSFVITEDYLLDVFSKYSSKSGIKKNGYPVHEKKDIICIFCSTHIRMVVCQFKNTFTMMNFCLFLPMEKRLKAQCSKAFNSGI